MLDSSSDSCGELVKWTSTPKMPDQFDEATDNIDFRIKVKPKGQESIKFKYTLKKGQELPYYPEVHGIHYFHIISRIILFSLSRV